MARKTVGKKGTISRTVWRVGHALSPKYAVFSRQNVLVWEITLAYCIWQKFCSLKTARVPETVEAVGQSSLQLPQSSTRKHATALGLSVHKVGRLLNVDLKSLHDDAGTGIAHA